MNLTTPLQQYIATLQRYNTTSLHHNNTTTLQTMGNVKRERETAETEIPVLKNSEGDTYFEVSVFSHELSP